VSQRTVEDEALLDAARACVLAVGVRRTTMTDVARRAGVSRMTLYRRHPDLTSLIQALMTREFSAIIGEVETAGGGGSARERLVEAAVAGADRLTRDPLFLRIVDVDPELLLPYVTTRRGAFQRAVLAAFERRIAEGVADGSIVAAADAAIVARTLELALRGFVLQTLAEDAEAARDGELAELRRMLDRYLAPAEVP
jgi:AcrR family transcriptional regulator